MAFVNRFTIILAFSVVATVLTIVKPNVLGKNVFLNGFVSHEILAMLIVIVAITLASVGNLHLTLTRIIRRKFKDQVKGEMAAQDSRKELDSNAWSLMWAFGLCVLVLITKGAFPKDLYVASGANGIALIILLFNMLILHDIYETVFGLVKSDADAEEHESE